MVWYTGMVTSFALKWIIIFNIKKQIFYIRKYVNIFNSIHIEKLYLSLLIKVITIFFSSMIECKFLNLSPEKHPWPIGSSYSDT